MTNFLTLYLNLTIEVDIENYLYYIEFRYKLRKIGSFMKPIYLDLHIHTSTNADSLNENYNVDLLLEKIKTKINGENYLISLTDHNTINKKAKQN